MHIAMHAFGKITLFFCAGAVYVALHKTEISTMNGIGRQMPFTMAAFLIGALSIIGLPPCGGAWSKWYPGARRAGGRAAGGGRGADAELAVERRVPAADSDPGVLPVARSG